MTDEKWQRSVEQQAKRMADARREQRSLLGQTVFIGTLSALFLVPLIAGAYLGRWLDHLTQGYSTRWTVSLIVLGIAAGVFNVYQFIRKYW